MTGTWSALAWGIAGTVAAGALAQAEVTPPPAPPAPAVAAPAPAAGSAADEAGGPPEVKIDRFTWDKDAAGEHPIRAVRVVNDYGDVRARNGGDGRVAVSAVIQRLGQTGAGVTVERRGDMLAIQVGYGAGRVQDSDPAPAKDSHDRVDLVVYVPEGVRLEAHTFRGMIEARKLKTDVRAATRDGSIFVLTTGAVQARSDSGDITVFPGATGGGPLVLETRSGAINVTLPEKDAAFDVRAETGGAVESDLELKRAAAGTRTLAAGTAGTGGRLLLATSETGAVSVYRWPGR